MKKHTPYYAVIFTSLLEHTQEGYDTMAELMIELAKQQTGFIGVESVRNELGITVSYWKTLEDISAWKQNVDHQVAQQLGRDKWYKSYKVRVCVVEREYEFNSLETT